MIAVPAMLMNLNLMKGLLTLFTTILYNAYLQKLKGTVAHSAFMKSVQETSRFPNKIKRNEFLILESVL